MKALAVGAFWIAVGIMAWQAMDWGFVKNEVTVYTAQCKVPVKNGRCSDHEFTLRPTTYKVLKDSQTVLYWVEGFPPDRLTKCAVVDRLNWQCMFADDSVQVGFTEGRHFENILGTPNPFTAEFRSKEYELSRWKYLQLTWNGK